jgi:hypothetical protein
VADAGASGAEEAASPTAAEMRAEVERADALEKIQWSWTLRGLGFHYARLVILLLSLLAFLLALILEGMHATPVAALLVGSGIGMSVVGPALGLIGSFLCFRIPRPVGARRFIALSLLLDVAVIPLNYFHYNGAFAATAEAIGLPPQYAGPVLFAVVQLTSWICYMFFQRRLAEFFDDSMADDEAWRILGSGILLAVALALVVAGLVVVLVRLPQLLANEPLAIAFIRPVAYLALLLLAFLYAKLLFRQLALIGTLRGLIRKAGF